MQKNSFFNSKGSKIVSEYDQEIPQSQTADKHMAPRGRATQQSRDTMKTNYASNTNRKSQKLEFRLKFAF